MTFIRDDQIQAAWITELQNNSAIIAEVDADQIKELQPQTTSFSYPGIRVRVGPNSSDNINCPQNVTVRILVFTEDASSQRCMRIAGIIYEQFHNKSFSASGLSQSMQFIGINANLFPAVRQDRNTWLEEVNVQMSVS